MQLLFNQTCIRPFNSGTKLEIEKKNLIASGFFQTGREKKHYTVRTLNYATKTKYLRKCSLCPPLTINCRQSVHTHFRLQSGEFKAGAGTSLMLNKRYHCLRFVDALSTFLFEVNQMSVSPRFVSKTILTNSAPV